MNSENTTEIPLRQADHEPSLNDTVDEPSNELIVSLEFFLYIGLAVIVILMRLINLGAVPLSLEEIPRALAGWQAVYASTVPPLLSDSGLVQMGHIITLSILGNGEAAVRVPTALVGLLLVFSPLLFRNILGKTRTFIMVLMLAASPVILAASRLDSFVIWEALVTVVMLLSVWHYRQTQQTNHAIAIVVLMMIAVLLAGSTGHVWMLILFASFALTERLYQLQHDPAEEYDIPISYAAYLRQMPWLTGLGIGALVVVAMGTGFMLYPTGLNAIGQSLGNGLTNWVQSSPLTPVFFPLQSSLIYEWIFWIFAIIGIWMTFRRDHVSGVDVFFVAWMVISMLVAILYAGGIAAHALWLTLPIVGLAAGAVERLLQNETGTLWYQDDDDLNHIFGLRVPVWAPWMISAIAAFLMSLIFLHLGIFSRTLQTTPLRGTEWSTVWERLGPSGLILLVLITLLAFVGFTAASLYGSRTTWRGGAIGLFVIGWFAALGSGWQITFNRANDPVELWYPAAVGDEAFVLRDTLLEIADRQTGGFPRLPVMIVVDDMHITEDGVVAWALRDFDNAQFVSTVTEAQSQPIVITPRMEDSPDLGGNYVGQHLVITRTWGTASPVTLNEIPAWIYQRLSYQDPIPHQEIVLWLRQDIYDGIQTLNAQS